MPMRWRITRTWMNILSTTSTSIQQLPFADASFDGVVVTVSIQYMIQPVKVFA